MSNLNPLQQLKTEASLLRKKLKSTDKEVQTAAAKRFLQLPFLKFATIEQVLGDIDFYQLKHAYWVLAIEHGYSNWQKFRDEIIKTHCMYDHSCGAYLNVWIADYEEAKTYHIEHGGYLLQYKKDYFICTDEVINALGLSSFKQEWEAIGYNWVKPLNKTAWNAIYQTAKKNYLDRLKASRNVKFYR